MVIVENPLCHCGKSGWDYGLFTNFLNLNEHLHRFNFEFSIYYKQLTEDMQSCYDDAQQINYPERFSRIVMCENPRCVPKSYLGGRASSFLNIVYPNEHQNEHNYKITQSNASRVFYNFYLDNVNQNDLYTMNTIGQIFSETNANINMLYSKMLQNHTCIQSQYIAIHFRFGDKRHKTTEQVDINNSHNDVFNKLQKYIDQINGLILPHETVGDINITTKPIIIMCDRDDALLLQQLKDHYSNVIFTHDLIAVDTNAVDANAVDANAVDANAVDTNAVDANAVDATQ